MQDAYMVAEIRAGSRMQSSRLNKETRKKDFLCQISETAAANQFYNDANCLHKLAVPGRQSCKLLAQTDFTRTQAEVGLRKINLQSRKFDGEGKTQ